MRTKIVKYIGMDVHKETISITIAEEGRDGDVRFYGQIANTNDALNKFIRKQISQNVDLRFVYEAGPCGYHLYRYLTGNNLDCTVVAPALIPKKSGDHIKTDRRDSESLARNHRAGELTAVYVPSPEDEALRDLVRGREDAVKALRTAKLQLGAFLLRHNIIYSGRSKWSKSHFNWLADITMPSPAQQIVLQDYIDTVQRNIKRVEGFTANVREQSEHSRLTVLIKAIQSMRGVSLIVAATICAEIGDLKRFDRPDKIMKYLGLVPSEHSSGKTRKQGAITKAGNGHVRRALIEAAQAYRLPARKSRAISKRQEGVPENICEIAWKAQTRLCGRYRRLTAKGKKSNVVKTAIARELSGFVWAIAQELPLAA